MAHRHLIDSDSPNQPGASRRCTTIEEIVEEMTRRWLALHRAGDWRAVFARTYLKTTEQLLEATRIPGAFHNPDWVVSIDCEFAHRYFSAIDCWDAGGTCPWPWRLAFHGATRKNTFAFQDILLGMNAHINYDLPYSLHATIPDGLSIAQLAAYREDNDQLNRVLAQIVNLIQAEIRSDYDPGLTLVDLGLGNVDEGQGARLIRIWRERSWSHFLLLHGTRGDPEARREVDQLIERTAIEYALLLLELQRIVPMLRWPNRLYRDSVNWIRRRRM
jgi:hypothetical protein